jgi:archaellum biogenesis protein FlaJ (TadC family)
MANEQRVPAGIGCLSTIVGVVVLAAVAVLVFFVGFVALVVVAGLLLLGFVVWAVDRVLLALSPKRRERREAQGRAFVRQFGWTESDVVIDATATEETTGVEHPGLDAHRPDEPPLP